MKIAERERKEKLEQRVPLGVARWHAHVNICLPPRGQGQQADWTKFGFRGSIATAGECERAGGRFWPQIFGWMIHVYPFETTPEKIWNQEQGEGLGIGGQGSVKTATKGTGITSRSLLPDPEFLE